MFTDRVSPRTEYLTLFWAWLRKCLIRYLVVPCLVVSGLIAFRVVLRLSCCVVWLVLCCVVWLVLSYLVLQYDVSCFAVLYNLCLLISSCCIMLCCVECWEFALILSDVESICFFIKTPGCECSCVLCKSQDSKNCATEYMQPIICVWRKPLYFRIRLWLHVSVFIWKRNFLVTDTGYRPHVYNDNDNRKRNFSKTLSRVELFENAV